VHKDIGTAWKSLENAEKGFEEWLLSEMQRSVCVFTTESLAQLHNIVNSPHSLTQLTHSLCSEFRKQTPSLCFDVYLKQ